MAATHDVWVEVDLGALQQNLRQVRGVLADGVRVMAVVKGNGFGHGCVESACAFVEAGADALAVTRLEEAMPIRAAGVSVPVLLFAPIQPRNARLAVDADLDMTVTSADLLRAVSEAALEAGKKARVHLKIDSGMGRLGVGIDEAVPLARSAANLPNVQIAGVYTHFATAAEADIAPASTQLRLFTKAIDGLKRAGLDFGIAHAANSAAILRMPDSHLEMVRPGTLLYGQYPSAHVPRKLDLRPTWTLKARVCEVKDLGSGHGIGYGREHVTTRRTRIAVVPVGYADGFTLAPEGPIYRQGVLRFAARRMRRSLYLEVRGRKAPVLGRVAMQMTTIDVTSIPGVSVGDEVRVPALRIPTSALIPRVYVAGS